MTDKRRFPTAEFLVSKSGGFGDENALIRLRNRLAKGSA
jgi:hypothetical protein